MSFARVQTNDRELNQVQSNIATALQSILSSPIVSGFALNGVSLSIGSNTINTGFNRPVTGFFITSLDGVAQIYNEPFSGPNVVLISDAAVTVNLYVF